MLTKGVQPCSRDVYSALANCHADIDDAPM
jgi:hypothetical protein